MADTSQTGIKRKFPRWVIATVCSIFIIVLLGVYAFLTMPGAFKPSEVTVAGTVTASGLNLDKITFTNTGCGTKNVVEISANGENSGAYAISLENGYSYNVSISWTDSESVVYESEVGLLVLDVFDSSIVRDWAVPP